MTIYHFRVSTFDPSAKHLTGLDFYIQCKRALTARLLIECVNVLDNEVLVNLGIVTPLLAPELVTELEDYPNNEARALDMALDRVLPDLSRIDQLSAENYSTLFKNWLLIVGDRTSAINDFNKGIYKIAPDLIDISPATGKPKTNVFYMAIRDYLLEYGAGGKSPV